MAISVLLYAKLLSLNIAHTSIQKQWCLKIGRFSMHVYIHSLNFLKIYKLKWNIQQNKKIVAYYCITIDYLLRRQNKKKQLSKLHLNLHLKLHCKFINDIRTFSIMKFILRKIQIKDIQIALEETQNFSNVIYLIVCENFYPSRISLFFLCIINHIFICGASS